MEETEFNQRRLQALEHVAGDFNLRPLLAAFFNSTIVSGTVFTLSFVEMSYLQ